MSGIQLATDLLWIAFAFLVIGAILFTIMAVRGARPRKSILILVIFAAIEFAVVVTALWTVR